MKTLVQSVFTFVFALVIATTSAPLVAQTIAHWSFSDGANGTQLSSTGGVQPIATDSISGRELLSISGSQVFSSNVADPSWGPTSLQVNGGSGYVQQVTPGTGTTLDDSSFDFGNGQAFTIEGFIRTAGEINGGSQVFLDKRNTASPNVGYRMFIDNAGTLHLLSDNGPDGGRVGFDDFAVDDGEWHHFAGVRETNGQMRIFVDYMEDVTPETNSVGTLVAGSLANSSPLTIGARPGGLDAFDGFLDEIRISDEALSVDQFLRATAVPEPHSIALWSMLGLLAIATYTWRRRSRR